MRALARALGGSVLFLIAFLVLQGARSTVGAADGVAPAPSLEPRLDVPFSFRDPDDPFRPVRWTSGLYLARRHLLNVGDRGLKTTIEYDLSGRRILMTRRMGTVEVLPPLVLTNEEFTRFATEETFRRNWEKGSTRVTTQARNAENQGILNVSLPFQVPFTEKLFGKGAPNLKVSGSERITLSGTSSWTVGQKDTERGKPSLFPRLDMRQQLNVNLRGTIGSKLSVDVAQNSEALTPLENAIKIRYKGEEDEILRSVELGNTNLSLPATQYVSFSARQEGLFGVKAEAKVGAVGITAIASRQEGEGGQATLVGGSQEQTQTVRDVESIRGKYFVVSDPDSSQFPILVPGSVRVFLDDQNVYNDIDLNAKPAKVYLDPNHPEVGPEVTGTFHELDQEIDFNVYNERAYQLPILALKNPLSTDQTLAVAYQESVTVLSGGVRRTNGTIREVGTFAEAAGDTTIFLKMLRPRVGDWGSDNLLESEWAPVRRLELKNYYSLRARNIDPTSFTLQITRNDQNQEPTITNYRGEQIPLIQVLGLDQINNETGAREPDNKVDADWILYEEGLLFFPDLRPFDPSAADIAGSAHVVGGELRGRSRSWPPVGLGEGRPDTLGWEGGLVPSTAEKRAQETTPEIYDLRINTLQTKSSDYTRYNIVATFKTTVSTLQLGNVGSIIENSETVRLNGNILQRGTDYTIIYETGEIQLKNPDASAPGADLVVTYNYDSPFSRGSRSLVGASLAYQGDANSKYMYSTSWLRESRGVPEIRPRLGQEPTKTTVGDFSGAARFQPWGLTRMVDRLPFVDTVVPSRIDVQAALGVSFPDPNTRGQVYIDDMEGAESITSAPMARQYWNYSSAPHHFRFLNGPQAGMEWTPPDEARGKLLWTSPATVREDDLRPKLDEFEGNNYIPVLDVIYSPNPAEPIEDSWGGLTAGLGRDGSDVSKAQYLEVWVNDFVPWENREDPLTGRRGELRVDLGAISEDAVWDPRIPPLPANGLYDYEDQNRNGGLIEAAEDVGLDLLPDSQETYDPTRIGGSPTGDKAGDDARRELGEARRNDTIADKIKKFDGINGTENNDIPDTEDTNLNGRFDQNNRYVEYAVDLKSDAFLDVTRDFTSVRDRERNGWRLYRIPLQDPNRIEINSPDLTTVTHLRLWFRGIEGGDTLNVQIGGVEIVGNRWERLPIRDAQRQEVPDATLEAAGSVFNVGVVNNKDNQNEYTPPFQVERRDRVTEREQSLSLEFENFQDGNEGRAYRSFLEPRDLTLYRELAFYLQPRLDPADSVEFFIRFGSNASTDTLSFYEIATVLSDDDARRRPDGWLDLRVDVADLSGLKIGYGTNVAADSFLYGPYDTSAVAEGLRPRKDLGDGRLVTIRGLPSFSQVRRMSVGLRNRSGRVLAEGRVWFDELRIGDVRRDNGWIGRASVAVTLADLASVTAQASLANEDFVRLGQSRGSGSRDLNYSIGTQLNAHKFIEDTGFQLPIKYTSTHTKRTPKFFANSDIEFTGRNTGRDITETGQDNLSFNLSRIPRGRSPFLLRTVVDPFRLSGQSSSSYNTTSTSVDTTARRQVNVNYSLNPNLPPLRLLGKFEFSPLPRTVAVGWSRGRTRRHTYARDRVNPALLNPTTLDTTDTGQLDLNATLNPIRNVSYTYSSSRDLIDEHFQTEVVRRDRPTRSFFGVGIGREVNQTQSLSASYSPPFTGAVRPRLTWTSSFGQNYQPTLTREDYSAAARSINNTNNVNVTMNVPLGRWMKSLASRPSAGPPGGAPDPELSKAEQKKKEQAEHLRKMEEMQRRQAAQHAGRALPDSLAAPEAAPADTAAAAAPRKKDAVKIRDLFTKVITVGDIQAAGGVQRRNSVSSVSGSPSLAYQLGFVQDPGIGTDLTEITDQTGSSITQSNNGRGQNYSGSTSVTLFQKISADIRYQKRIDKSATAGATNNVRDDTTWPEVRIEWGDIYRRLPLVSGIFTDFRLVSSSYSRTTSKSGTETNPNQQVTISSNWRPLVKLEGTLRGGWRTRLGLDRTSSEARAERPGIATNINLRGTTTITASFSRTFTRKKSDGSARSFDYTGDVTYSKNTNETVDPDGRTVQSRSNDNLQVRNSATIRFTRTVSGTFGLNVGQQRDISANRTTRSVGVSFATGFNF